MAQLNFNAEDAPESDFEPIPKDEYEMHIIQTDMKDTKAGDGSFLECRIQILEEGDYQGRLLFERFNLVNPSEVAVRIAQRQLAQLCEAIGILSVEDSEELHDIPFVGVVDIEAGKGDYGPQNRIKKYLAV
jgi:hypothetical protein